MVVVVKRRGREKVDRREEVRTTKGSRWGGLQIKGEA